jgi:Flp pilus assembly protein TadD
LPDGSPPQRQIRFTLTTENGLRNEMFFTDAQGRITLHRINTPYQITVESDGQTYETTTVSFDPAYTSNHIIIHLKPLKPRPSTPPGTIKVNELEQKVSPKAKEAYEAAAKLILAGQYAQAVEPLKRAIAIEPNYFRAYNELGVIYLKLNQLDQAAEALRQAIKINDKSPFPQFNLGLVLNQQGKHEEAAGVLSKLQHHHPELAAVHAPLIEALMGAQQWAQAEEQLKLALAKPADVAGLKIKLGIVRIKRDKFAEAAAVLREAAEAEPGAALAHYYLGVALFQTGSLDEAEIALIRAYQLEGAKLAGAQLLLGQVYSQKKDYPKAIAAFEAYLRDLPEAPNAEQVKMATQKLRTVLKH